jgi:hypothetical protein
VSAVNKYLQKGIRCGVLDDIYEERQRQIDIEGWTPEHDDEHSEGEMAMAAACYAVSDKVGHIDRDPFLLAFWPWLKKSWKPKDQRRDLIKAAALIVAEIERLDRQALTEAEGTKTPSPREASSE